MDELEELLVEFGMMDSDEEYMKAVAEYKARKAAEEAAAAV